MSLALVLADLLFNHSEHTKLVKSIMDTLRRGVGCYALVFFTPYRPWLLDKDMDFFRVATESGLRLEKVLEKEMDNLMFESDPGVSLFATEERKLNQVKV
jgi:EEF1A N-terminal glycine/lysine methyltransferase